MTDAKTVPLTVLATNNSRSRPAIKLGREGPEFKGDASGAGTYWMVILDLNDLKVVYNESTHEYHKAPDIGNFNTREHLLIVSTYCLGTGHVPHGDFYDFLWDNGAGAHLRRIVQLNNTLGCGSWGSVEYVLIGVLGPGRPSIRGIEGSNIESYASGLIVMAEMVPTQIGDRTIYRPQPLGV